METLKDFYRCIRPAGWWAPIRRELAGELDRLPKDTFKWDIATAIIGGVGLQALFLTSTYACTHQWKAVGVSLLVVAVVGIVLYFTWYKHLPDVNEGQAVAVHDVMKAG
jgi:hypothetical protein